MAAENRYFNSPVEQEYVLKHQEVLGMGCAGAVVVGQHRQTGERRAVKRYRKRKLSPEALERV